MHKGRDKTCHKRWTCRCLGARHLAAEWTGRGLPEGSCVRRATVGARAPIRAHPIGLIRSSSSRSVAPELEKGDCRPWWTKGALPLRWWGHNLWLSNWRTVWYLSISTVSSGALLLPVCVNCAVIKHTWQSHFEGLWWFICKCGWQVYLLAFNGSNFELRKQGLLGWKTEF